MSKTRNTLLLAGLLVATAAPAATATDYTALREDAHVHERLLTASKAYLIEKACPTIERRKLYLLGQVMKLQSYARGLGYTNKEISAYVDDKAEQARFRALAEPWIAERGGVKGDAESYCAVGRAEIENNTPVGAMMRLD